MHTEQLWLVSFAEDDDRELTTEEVARALGRHEVDFATLVWREGLATWHPLSAFEEFSGIGTSSPGFIWPSTKSDAPPPEEEPATVRTIRPPLPERHANGQHVNGNGERRPPPPAEPFAPVVERMSPKAQQAKISAAEEELEANDLLWLPADSEPVSSDFLGLSRPDASLVPPPINVPAPDPLDSRDSKASALEAAMAFRVRVAPMPDVSATTRPVSKDSVAPPERKSVACMPWVIAASLVTAAGYFIFTQRAAPVAPTSYASPAPVEHVATQTAMLPPPVETTKPSTPVEPKNEPAQVAAALPATPDTATSAAEAKPVEAKPAEVTPTEVPNEPASQPSPAVKAPSASVAERPVVAPPKKARVESAVDEKPREASKTVSSLKQETTATDPFDKVAAMAALEQAAGNASACRKEGDPSGTAEVRVTFSPSGRATQAVLSGPPFAGTMTGSCIATAMRAARMPPFLGERTTVQKRVIIK